MDSLRNQCSEKYPIFSNSNQNLNVKANELEDFDKRLLNNEGFLGNLDQEDDVFLFDNCSRAENYDYENFSLNNSYLKNFNNNNLIKNNLNYVNFEEKANTTEFHSPNSINYIPTNISNDCENFINEIGSKKNKDIFYSSEYKNNEINAKIAFSFNKTDQNFATSLFIDENQNTINNKKYNKNLIGMFDQKNTSYSLFEICDICAKAFKNKATKIKHKNKEHSNFIKKTLLIIRTENVDETKPNLINNKTIGFKREKCFATDGKSLYSKFKDSEIFRKEPSHGGHNYIDIHGINNFENNLQGREMFKDALVQLTSTELPKFPKKISHFKAYFQKFKLYKLEKNKNNVKDFIFRFEIFLNGLIQINLNIFSFFNLNRSKFWNDYLNQLNGERKIFMQNSAIHEKNITIDMATICFLNNNLFKFNTKYAIYCFISILLFRDFVISKINNTIKQKNKELNDLLNLKKFNSKTFLTLRDSMINSNKSKNSVSIQRSAYKLPIKSNLIHERSSSHEINLNQKEINISSIEHSPINSKFTSQNINLHENINNNLNNTGSSIEDFVDKNKLLSEISSPYIRKLMDLILFHDFKSINEIPFEFTSNISCNTLPIYVHYFNAFLYINEKEISLVEEIFNLNNYNTHSFSDKESIENDSIDLYEKVERCDFLFGKEKTYRLKVEDLNGPDLVFGKDLIIMYVIFFMSWLKYHKYTVFEINSTNLQIENKHKEFKKMSKLPNDE